MSDQQKHILCIDDEPDMLELLTIILKRTGVKVSGANNGLDGLRMIDELKPDLVILDLMMPIMGGWEVYQQIKADENIRHIPVIIVTAKAQQVDRVLGIHIAKVEDYITKPFSPSELVASVTRVLNKQQE
jgi:DNA-binding response OmpR family regulator